MANLFEKFGEFDSYIEINEAAKGLLQEGDTEGLRELAKENGLEEEVEWYLNGETEDLCDPLSAALGKLKVERREENSLFYDDVADYLMANCDDIDFAMSVRRIGKRMEDAAGLIWKEANKNTATVHGRQCNYCGPIQVKGTFGKVFSKAKNTSYVTKTIQRALKNLGFYTGKIDGAWGTATTKAVNKFRKLLGWLQTGKIGKTALKRLMEIL